MGRKESNQTKKKTSKILIMTLIFYVFNALACLGTTLHNVGINIFENLGIYEICLAVRAFIQNVLA